jgi:hypothetical protein
MVCESMGCNQQTAISKDVDVATHPKSDIAANLGTHIQRGGMTWFVHQPKWDCGISQVSIYYTHPMNNPT